MNYKFHVKSDSLSKLSCCCGCAKSPELIHSFSHTPIGWNILLAITGATVSYKIPLPICQRCLSKNIKYNFIPWVPIGVGAFPMLLIEVDLITSKSFKMFAMILFPICFFLSIILSIVFEKRKPFIISRVHNDNSFDICFKNSKVNNIFQEYLKKEKEKENK